MGINNIEKRKLIREFLNSQKVNLVCLQETKLKGLDRGILRSLATERFANWTAVNAKGGASGGILIFWDSRMMQLVDVEEIRYSLPCKFRFLDDNFTWIFTGVYGPTSKGERELLWEDLGAIRGLWGEP